MGPRVQPADRGRDDDPVLRQGRELFAEVRRKERDDDRRDRDRDRRSAGGDGSSDTAGSCFWGDCCDGGGDGGD